MPRHRLRRINSEPPARLVKLNSDTEPELSSSLGVRAIPTLLLFHKGRELARTAGAMSTEALVTWTRQVLEKAV